MGFGRQLNLRLVVQDPVLYVQPLLKLRSLGGLLLYCELLSGVAVNPLYGERVILSVLQYQYECTFLVLLVNYQAVNCNRLTRASSILRGLETPRF
jgi:hypothetical protein